MRLLLKTLGANVHHAVLGACLKKVLLKNPNMLGEFCQPMENIKSPKMGGIIFINIYHIISVCSPEKGLCLSSLLLSKWSVWHPQAVLWTTVCHHWGCINWPTKRVLAVSVVRFNELCPFQRYDATIILYISYTYIYIYIHINTHIYLTIYSENNS